MLVAGLLLSADLLFHTSSLRFTSLVEIVELQSQLIHLGLICQAGRSATNGSRTKGIFGGSHSPPCIVQRGIAPHAVLFTSPGHLLQSVLQSTDLALLLREIIMHHPLLLRDLI